MDDHGHEYLKVTATAVLPSIKGKAFVSFILDRNTYTHWPLSMQGLKVDVKVAYGDVQYVPILIICYGAVLILACREEVILQGLRESLAGFTPARNYGCLLDACAESTGQFV